MLNPSEEVIELDRLLRENAQAAGFDPKDIVYSRVDPDSGNFLIGSNYEDGTPTYVRDPQGQWFIRNAWDGETKPYTFEKACADARIMWTG